MSQPFVDQDRLCVEFVASQRPLCSLCLCALCVKQDRRMRALSFNTEDTEAQSTQSTRLSNSEDNDPLTQRIIGCVIEVHRTLGPGLLESFYEQCMAHEMTLQQSRFGCRFRLPSSARDRDWTATSSCRSV